jgi:hypothetical protein
MMMNGRWEFNCGCSEGNGPRAKHEHTYQWVVDEPFGLTLWERWHMVVVKVKKFFTGHEDL